MIMTLPGFSMIVTLLVGLYDFGTSWEFFIIVVEKYHSEILNTHCLKCCRDI